MKEQKVPEKDIAKLEAEELDKAIKESLELEVYVMNHSI
jgi:hypothetical protein